MNFNQGRSYVDNTAQKEGTIGRPSSISKQKTL